MKKFLLAVAISFCAAAFASAQTAIERRAIERRAIDKASLDFPAFAQVDVDNASSAMVDNSAWNRFLDRYLARRDDGVTLISYAAVTAADKAALKAYLAKLEATDPTALASDDQLAFWLNLYNALTVDVILDHYPVDSIRDIKDRPLDFKGPWNNRRVTVRGEALSLDDIEHAIIRPIYNEPRIHYGVNFASIGCPNLQPKAFEGDSLDAALSDAARAFINHPRGIRVDGKRIIASKLYAWFREDFGDNDAAILDHIRRYANPDLAADLEGRTRINSFAYDWTLNDAP